MCVLCLLEHTGGVKTLRARRTRDLSRARARVTSAPDLLKLRGWLLSEANVVSTFFAGMVTAGLAATMPASTGVDPASAFVLAVPSAVVTSAWLAYRRLKNRVITKRADAALGSLVALARRTEALEDSSAKDDLLAVLGAAAVSVLAVGEELARAKNPDPKERESQHRSLEAVVDDLTAAVANLEEAQRDRLQAFALTSDLSASAHVAEQLAFAAREALEATTQAKDADRAALEEVKVASAHGARLRDLA